MGRWQISYRQIGQCGTFDFWHHFKLTQKRSPNNTVASSNIWNQYTLLTSWQLWTQLKMSGYILHIEFTLTVISHQEMNSLFEPVQHQVNSAEITMNSVVMGYQLYMDCDVSVNQYSNEKLCGRGVMLLLAHVHMDGKYIQSCITGFLNSVYTFLQWVCTFFRWICTFLKWIHTFLRSCHIFLMNLYISLFIHTSK